MRAAALIALLCSGCSMLLIKKPPDRGQPEVYPVCHEGPAGPVADLVLATLSGLIAFGIFDEDGDTDSDEFAAGAIFTVLALLHGSSGVLGLHWTSRCKRMHDDWQRDNPVRPVRGGRLRRPAAAEGALGAACFPNRTCNDGLACGPGQRCVTGDRGLEGLACFDDGSCSGDLGCVSGMCTRPPPAECVTDAHCPEGLGLVCQGGYCVSPPVAP